MPALVKSMMKPGHCAERSDKAIFNSIKIYFHAKAQGRKERKELTSIKAIPLPITIP
jgi:hypothetical protein